MDSVISNIDMTHEGVFVDGKYLELPFSEDAMVDAFGSPSKRSMDGFPFFEWDKLKIHFEGQDWAGLLGGVMEDFRIELKDFLPASENIKSITVQGKNLRDFRQESGHKDFYIKGDLLPYGCYELLIDSGSVTISRNPMKAHGLILRKKIRRRLCTHF